MSQESKRGLKLLEAMSKETRLFILECSVFIEEKVSETLGRILNIEWRNSESLGFSSGSIGLDHKIKLIKDLKGLKEQIPAKFQAFMAIRNKFAHIIEIDSFEAYNRLISASKDRKKEFKKWFPNIDLEGANEELAYKRAYLQLTLELFEQLWELTIRNEYSKGYEDGRSKATERLVHYLRVELNNSEEGQIMWARCINSTFPEEPTQKSQ